MANLEKTKISVEHNKSFVDGKVDDNYFRVVISRENSLSDERFMVDVDLVPLLVEELNKKLKSIK